MNGINLIPGPRMLARRRAARLRMWLAIGPCVALIIGGAHAYCFTAWNTSTADLDERIAALEARASAAKSAAAAIQADVQREQARLTAARIVAHQPDWGRVTSLVADRLGDRAVLSGCTLEPAEGRAASVAQTGRPVHYRLTLRGYALEQQAVSDVAVELHKAGVFDAVKLVESRRSAFRGADAVSFQIECAITDLPSAGETP